MRQIRTDSNDASAILDNKLQGLEMNPWMLTLLGVGAGVLVVIVLVAVAIRVHASRGGRAGRRRR